MQGESVLDLGSGPGMDAILAAKLVGTQGHIAGLDSNASMLSLANTNLRVAKAEKPNLANISFKHSILPNIDMPDQSFDVVMSNCVLNLLPDEEKPVVWTEIARVLKKGGRVVISNVCARRQLPEKVKRDVGLLVGCVAGAAEVGVVRGWIGEAGLGGEYLFLF
jgi:arsenite methyltransferase